MHHNEIDLKIAAFTCEKCPDSQAPEEGDDKLPEGCELMKELCDRFDNETDTDGVPVTLKDLKNALEDLDSEEVEDAIRDKLGVEPDTFMRCMKDMEKKKRMFSKKLKEEVCSIIFSIWRVRLRKNYLIFSNHVHLLKFYVNHVKRYNR